MDVYSTSFNLYPFADTRSTIIRQPLSDFSSSTTPTTATAAASAPVHRHHSTNSGVEAVWESLNRLSHQAMSTHPGVSVSFARTDDHQGFNIHITGPYHPVMAARGLILRESPAQNRSSIRLARSEILEPRSSALKPQVIRMLDEIAAQTRANISVLKTVSAVHGGIGPNGIEHGGTSSSSVNDGAWSAGLETEKMCELIITGTGETVDVARIRLLVMLDEMSGLHAEPAEIDYKLHAIIAGRKRRAIQTIQEETATNIYFPPLPLLSRASAGLGNGVNANGGMTHATNGNGNGNGNGTVPRHGSSSPESINGSGADAYNPNMIWITGEFFGVQRARDSLYQLAMHKVRSKIIISRDTAILPRKLDWMLTQRLDDLNAIMKDQGTYIALPTLGSLTSRCTVYGDNRSAIERTVRAVMALAAQFYVASFWLLPISFNVLMPASVVNSANMPLVLRRISNATGAEVVFKSNCFEMHGLEPEVRVAVGMILELELVQNFHHEIRFQLELANEHREFISGKKNGKMNKIMSSANVKIKFETFNEHNFLIDVSGTDAGVIHGLTLLQEELPAEISFHVPEVYHKRIIGVGGRSIQRIMKKYGVYVKFNSADELVAASMDDEDNVLARTPAKNALNLDNLKQSVMELVNPKDKDYVLETVSIPRRYHRSLFGEKSIFLRDIESKTNSVIRFPGDGLDYITIFGPESQVHIAAAMVLDHVPFEAEMTVPSHPDLARLSTSPDFLAFSDRVKREYQVSITPSASVISNNTGGEPPSFKFRCQRSNSDCLGTAREMLEAFLMSKHMHVFPSPATAHKRIDSFTDAFPHFNSKLLSTALSAESPEFARPAEGLVERRIRMATSTPDVKALFNSPSLVYRVPEQDEPDEDSYYSRSSIATSSSGLNDYWNPSRLHLPPPVGRVASVDETYLKRGSDSLLEAKYREKLAQQNLKQRSLTTRAQSLDLTSLSLSRSTSTSINNPTSISETDTAVPDSPTDSGTNPSPPQSAMIPSFPSVYGPSNGLAVGSSTRQQAGVDSKNEVRELSDTFANFRLDAHVH